MRSLETQNTAGGREKAAGGWGRRGEIPIRVPFVCTLLLCSQGGAGDGDKAKHQGQPQRLRVPALQGQMGKKKADLGPWMGEDGKQEAAPSAAGSPGTAEGRGAVTRRGKWFVLGLVCWCLLGAAPAELPCWVQKRGNCHCFKASRLGLALLKN